MTDHWQSYWDRHAGSVGSDDPLRQVLRTEHGEPMSDEAFARVAEHVVGLLELGPEHTVLDLCCGNGLLTAAIEPHVGAVVAADFAERLLQDVSLRTGPKTTTRLADARTAEFEPGSFDRVLIAAAVQNFELGETVRLFGRIAASLRPGGIFVLTDIPDSARIWSFHNTPAYEDAYFEGEAAGAPILGTWFDRVWMEKLGRHAGFAQSTALDQPGDLQFSHYRFDLVCRL